MKPPGWKWKWSGIGFLPLGGEPVEYGQAYFDRYAALCKTPQGELITAMRVGTVMQTFGCRSITSPIVVDLGVGCGHFIQRAREAGLDCYGNDINPVAIKWLEEKGWRCPQFRSVTALTMWDVLEHIENPVAVFEQYKPRFIFVSMPIYRDEAHALASKHFKPGEHCWYFTRAGLLRFMYEHGFTCIALHQRETIQGGREDIESFTFIKSDHD